MRGKVYAVFAVLSPTGITPAYAGKSWKISIYAPDEWDHPRLCGEKIYTYRKSTGRQGSPPPMRGKVGNRLKSNFIHGITPAYAGKRTEPISSVISCGDHPRLCGEKYQTRGFFSSPRGSPPPMRGKEKHSTQPRAYTGITPAYAGKRPKTERRKKLNWDHPRLCGEKPQHPLAWKSRRGSPPPMRGKGPDSAGQRYIGRITPAYAGKSP